MLVVSGSPDRICIGRIGFGGVAGKQRVCKRARLWANCMGLPVLSVVIATAITKSWMRSRSSKPCKSRHLVVFRSTCGVEKLFTHVKKRFQDTCFRDDTLEVVALVNYRDVLNLVFHHGCRCLGEFLAGTEWGRCCE